MQRKSIFILLSVLCFAAAISAQNSTSSPYSRFGYGELNDNIPGGYRAMGGVSIGMRNNKTINPAQPASYSVVDSTTFMFDIGASGMWTNQNDANGSRNRGNGNLEYISLQFPIWKYIGFSAGVMPYSMVGYQLSDNDSTATHPYTRTFSGKGGITEVYGGLSFNILNWAAIGANIYYMFGQVNNTRSLTFSETNFTNVNMESTLHVSDIRLRYGVQIFHTFGKHTLVLGGIYEHNSRLNGNFDLIETIREDTIDTPANAFGLPQSYGAGISYTFDNRLTLAFDYSATNWAAIQYFGNVGSFRNRARYSIGAEYRHDPLGKRYIERMPWRAGFCLTDSYLLNNMSKDFSIAIGVGLPLRTVGTVINTTLEYGHRGAQSALQENYLRLTLNISVAENWFFKRRL